MILNAMNEVSRELSEQRVLEGEIEGLPTEGYQLLGVNPARINDILRAETLRTDVI